MFDSVSPGSLPLFYQVQELILLVECPMIFAIVINAMSTETLKCMEETFSEPLNSAHQCITSRVQISLIHLHRNITAICISAITSIRKNICR